jgi:hypothetical protein
MAGGKLVVCVEWPAVMNTPQHTPNFLSLGSTNQIDHFAGQSAVRCSQLKRHSTTHELPIPTRISEILPNSSARPKFSDVMFL